MYIDEVPNRNSNPAILLREGWREGRKTRQRTLANLSHWPPEKIEALRRLLRGEQMVPADEFFTVEQTTPHGHVDAVLYMIRKLEVDTIIGSKPCRERNLVIAMIAERLIHPCSKLATTRLWHTTTLAEELDVQDADVDELYEAMDWLLDRKKRIENKLARRHLSEGAQVLYDITSSYYEGRTCPLARNGYDRDGKGKPCIVYGVLTDHDGRPVAVDIYPGGTGDPTTVPDQVEKLRSQFGLTRIVLVGDRGMLTQTQIDNIKNYPGLGWISALRSQGIQTLVEKGYVDMSLFDHQNLAEISSPDFPGERLVVCFNPLLAEDRARTRKELLAATERSLDKIAKEVRRRTRKPLTEKEIALKVGRKLNRYKMAKHFNLTIRHSFFAWERNEDSIRKEQALDGIYVIRTSEAEDRLSAEDTVRSYKGLAKVEYAFRTLKWIEILVRPIRHRTENRVPAHIFLCLLAYYVEWHMRQALKTLLFDDEELEENRKTRDPVAPAEPSASAKIKKRERLTADGLSIHSWETLVKALATRCRNVCRVGTDPTGPTFTRLTDANPLQLRVQELLEGYVPM
jgi:transposase